MNKTMQARLRALEREKSPDLAHVIVVNFVRADGGVLEPEAYRDGRGGRWIRQPGEAFDAFRERATFGARAGALPQCRALLLPDDDDYDS
jgi:hypothetical protein